MPLIKPLMPLANPAVEIRAEHLQRPAGLGLHLSPDRVITKPAINLIVFHRDLQHGVDVVPVVIRRLKVGVIADLLLVGIGAQLQDVHASVVLKSCEGLFRRAPK